MVSSVSSGITNGGVSEKPFVSITPLEKVVGFKVAERTYDQLTLREQIIIDLLVLGYNQADIAQLYRVTQPSINTAVRRIRITLADSELKMILDAREHFRNQR